MELYTKLEPILNRNDSSALEGVENTLGSIVDVYNVDTPTHERAVDDIGEIKLNDVNGQPLNILEDP